MSADLVTSPPRLWQRKAQSREVPMSAASSWCDSLRPGRGGGWKGKIYEKKKVQNQLLWGRGVKMGITIKHEGCHLFFLKKGVSKEFYALEMTHLPPFIQCSLIFSKDKSKCPPPLLRASSVSHADSHFVKLAGYSIAMTRWTDGTSAVSQSRGQHRARLEVRGWKKMSEVRG